MWLIKQASARWIRSTLSTTVSRRGRAMRCLTGDVTSQTELGSNCFDKCFKKLFATESHMLPCQTFDQYQAIYPSVASGSNSLFWPSEAKILNYQAKCYIHQAKCYIFSTYVRIRKVGLISIKTCTPSLPRSSASIAVPWLWSSRCFLFCWSACSLQVQMQSRQSPILSLPSQRSQCTKRWLSLLQSPKPRLDPSQRFRPKLFLYLPPLPKPKPSFFLLRL